MLHGAMLCHEWRGTESPRIVKFLYVMWSIATNREVQRGTEL